MSQTLIGRASFLILLNIAIKPLYILGIDLQVQNTVGPESYGLFFALFNLGYLFQIVHDFGLPGYTARQIAQNPDAVRRQLPTISQAKIGLALLYGSIVIVIAYLLGYQGAQLSLLGILLFNHVLIGYLFYLRANFTGLHLFRKDGWLSILDKASMLVLVGAFLLIPVLRAKFTIYTFAWLQSLSLLIAIAVGIRWMYRQPWSFTVRHLRWSELILLLKRSAPFALTVFLMTLYTRLDAVMIERLAVNGAYEAGVYAAGYRLLDGLQMLLFLIASILLPMFARLWKEQHELANLFRAGFKLTATITLVVAISLHFYAEFWIDWLYKDSEPYWGQVFAWLILTFFAAGWSYLFSTYRTASGELGTMNILFGLGIIGNVILNALWIPQFGAWGAALATLLTQSLIAIGLIIISPDARSFLSRREILLLIVVTAAYYGCGHFIRQLNSTYWMLNWLLVVALGLAFSWQLKWIDRNTLTQIFRKNHM